MAASSSPLFVQTGRSTESKRTVDQLELYTVKKPELGRQAPDKLASPWRESPRHCSLCSRRGLLTVKLLVGLTPACPAHQMHNCRSLILITCRLENSRLQFEHESRRCSVKRGG